MPMRQLRSCDFCGDDAAGVYEVFPPELSPTEAEQHRVVLCSDCVGTLEAVVNPLLERLGVDTGSDDTDTTPDGSPPPASTPDPQSTRSRGRGDRDPTTGSEASPETDTPAGISPSATDETDLTPNEHTSGDGSAATDDEPAPSEERSPGDESGPSTDPFSSAEDKSPSPAGEESPRSTGDAASPAGDEPPRSTDDEPSSPTGDDPDDGPVEWGTGDSPSTDDTPDDSPVKWGTGDAASPDDTPDTSGSDPIHNGIPSIEPSKGTDADAETASTPSEPGPTNDTDDPEPTDTEGRDANGPDEEPEEFRTVMRLLNGREFPVERDTIVELATSAYELDDAHVRRCLDYAVDRGVIDDDGGMLRPG